MTNGNGDRWLLQSRRVKTKTGTTDDNEKGEHDDDDCDVMTTGVVSIGYTCRGHDVE